jgi:hypothetical protein
MSETTAFGLDAYLDRIGLDGLPKPTLEALSVSDLKVTFG